MRVYEYHGTDDFPDQPYHEVPYKELWQGFVNDTSTAGIPRYAAAKGWCKRFTWMLLTLTVTGILGYHFYTIVERYRLRPVSIQQEILQNYNMEFPAVTFCNMNPVKKTAVGGNKELSSIVAKKDQELSPEAKKRRRRDIWMAAQQNNRVEENAIFNEFKDAALYAEDNREQMSNGIRTKRLALAFPGTIVNNDEVDEVDEVQVPAVDEDDGIDESQLLTASYCNPAFLDERTGKCYGLSSQFVNATWEESSDHCKAAGGQLAMITDGRIQDFIATIRDTLFANLGNGTKVHINLRNNRWMGLYPYSGYENFNGSPPDTSDSEATCGTAGISHQKWKNKDCDSYRSVGLCEKHVECPFPLYVDENGQRSCFFVVDQRTPTDYDTSVRVCRNLGGYNYAEVATLDTSDKLAHINNIVDDITDTTNFTFWLNAKLNSTAGRFEWQTSGRIASNYTWAVDQPKPCDGECMAGQFQNGEFAGAKTVDCNSDAFVMCEIKEIPGKATVCRRTQIGKEYTGIVSRSANGSLCSAWTAASYTSDDFPDASVEAAMNYCRNPDESDAGPWCYGAESGEKELCNVPYCNTIDKNIEAWVDLGCYDDIAEDRDMNYTYGPLDTMTNQLCAQHCMQQGYLYAATTGSDTCYCGDEYGRHGPSSDCTQACDGDSQQICGGVLALSVLEIQQEGRTPTTHELFDTDCTMTTEEATTEEVTTETPTTTTITTTTTRQPKTTTSEPVCPSVAPPCPCVCEDAVKPPPPEPIILVAPPPPAPTPAPVAPAGDEGEEVEPVRKPTTADYKEQAAVTETLSAMPEENKKSLGYSSWEFIVDCVVEGVPCDPQLDFEQFYNPVHGNCYVFNTGWNRTHTPFIAHKTGRVHGLSVTINIAQDEYTDSIGGPAGARVVVHNARSMPHPEEQGVLAMPGQLTSIGVVKVEVERLPDPYGDCIQPSDADAEKDVYADIFNVNYTRIGCFKTCYQKEVIAQCGCFDASIPGKGKPYGDSNVKVCQQENDEQEDCKFHISRQYIKGKLGCDAKCPSPCFDSYFKPTMSTAYWPSKVHLDRVVDSVASRIPNLIYYDSEKVYRENLLKVEVFYEEFNSEKTVEIPAYPSENFASDIGGVLGLWLGWSVLTIFEFFELAMDFLVMTTAKLTRSKSRNSKDDWPESRSGSDDTLQMSFPEWNSPSPKSVHPIDTRLSAVQAQAQHPAISPREVSIFSSQSLEVQEQPPSLQKKLKGKVRKVMVVQPAKWKI